MYSASNVLAVNVHVATDNIFPQVSAAGTILGDGPRALEAHAGWKTDGGAAPLARAIVSDIHRGQDVNILAHSMGGLVTGQGVQIAEDTLQHEGMTPQLVQRTMHDHVHVVTVGSAENHNTPGPRYDNIISELDPVAWGLGPGSPGSTSQGPVRVIPGIPGDANIIDDHLMEHYMPDIGF
jgi:hypothetical protein